MYLYSLWVRLGIIGYTTLVTYLQVFEDYGFLDVSNAHWVEVTLSSQSRVLSGVISVSLFGCRFNCSPIQELINYQVRKVHPWLSYSSFQLQQRRCFLFAMILNIFGCCLINFQVKSTHLSFPIIGMMLIGSLYGHQLRLFPLSSLLDNYMVVTFLFFCYRLLRGLNTMTNFQTSG